MNFLANFWYIFVALFCLGFSIFIHELGHFIAARMMGVRVGRTGEDRHRALARAQREGKRAGIGIAPEHIPTRDERIRQQRQAGQ